MRAVHDDDPPMKLLDAARIDGASEFRIFPPNYSSPLCKPALATQTLFTFTGHWGAYIWPLICVNSDRLRYIAPGNSVFLRAVISVDQNLIKRGIADGHCACADPVPPSPSDYFVEGITITRDEG